MALVVICGQPCSGKSTAALCLAEVLKESDSNSTIRIIDEASFHLARNQSYADMTAEKNLRGVLRSEVDRSVSKDSIIIVDSLNSIKGYRVKCEATYDDPIFEDLTRRFERLDRRNRWDVKILHPTIATQSTRFSEANSLYELDRATQEVTNVIVEAQSQSIGVPINGIPLGQGLPTLNMSRPVGLPELWRLRRTFIKLTGQTSLSGPPSPSDAESAKRMFVDYLSRELGAT